MGLAGIDFVILDGEHGTFSWESLEDMCRVADLAGVTTIARVPNIEESTILRYLDRGVQGILGPGIDTGEQAQQLVDACYYAPLGRRGLGGAPRAADYVNLAGREYLDGANREMLVVAFLEHAEALENLDDILAVDGIHAYYVGPQDMSVSLGAGRSAAPPADRGGDRAGEAGSGGPRASSTSATWSSPTGPPTSSSRASRPGWTRTAAALA